VDLRNDAAKCCPTLLIHGERHYLLIIRHQVGAEYWTHAFGITGALELDRTIHAVGVGAGEGAEPALRRCLSQQLRTRCAETEGEVGVAVEMGEHL
jgi:hypothetical protein